MTEESKTPAEKSSEKKPVDNSNEPLAHGNINDRMDEWTKRYGTKRES